VLPGGLVERNESLLDAFRREVRVKTGLIVDVPERLVYVAHVDNRDEDAHSASELPARQDLATFFVFEVTKFRGELSPADPDHYILDAAFLTRSKAIERLRELPSRVLREPIVEALNGDAPLGSVWLYQRRSGSDEFIGRIPAISHRINNVQKQDPRQLRERGLLLLGCLVAALLVLGIVLVGIIAAAHPHLF